MRALSTDLDVPLGMTLDLENEKDGEKWLELKSYRRLIAH